MTKPLSPAAQAVLDAFSNRRINSREFCSGVFMRLKLAAALHAVAGPVPKKACIGDSYASGFVDGIAFGSQFLHELATELETHS